MAADIFEKFGIKYKDPAKINIIGLDDGAGCSSAALVTKTGNSFETIKLTFDADLSIYNLYSVFSFDETGKLYLGQNASQGDGARNRSHLYTNFKVPPGQLAAVPMYEDRENFPSLTYEGAMNRYFCGIVQALFDSNNRLKGKHRTVLFVGRPASGVWQEKEVAYRDLLCKDLKVDGYDGTIDIVVYSEAQAALAFEYSQKNVDQKKSESVLIIDCGCSTFDAVLVKDRKIIAEYSRQLGAGMIEHLMYAKILSQTQTDSPMEDVKKRDAMVAEQSKKLTSAGSQGAHILNLRKIKEAYFGPNGTDGDKLNLSYNSIFVKNGAQETQLKQAIDKAFMDDILTKYPITVKASYDSMKDETYGSFEAAVRDFLIQTKKACGKEKADRVILTGGASVMPLIGDLIREIFRQTKFFFFKKDVASEHSVDPTFSVSKGLAVMGYVEFKKRKVRGELASRISAELKNHSAEIRDCVAKAYADLAWSRICRNLEEWVETTGSSVPLLSRKDDEKCGVTGDGTFTPPIKKVQENITQYLKDSMLIGDVQQTIHDAFHELFPGTDRDYPFRADLDAVAQVISGTTALDTIEFYPSQLLGWLRIMSQKYYKPVPDKKERRKYARIITRREKTIRAGLHTQLSKKASGAVDALSKHIETRMMEALDEYMDTVTPFLVEEAQKESSIPTGVVI